MAAPACQADIEISGSEEEARPPATAASQPGSGPWAARLAVCVVPLGAATAARRAIWEGQLRAAGGVVVAPEAGRLGWSSELTHLVVAPDVSGRRFQDWASSSATDLSGSVRIVTTAWLVESIAKLACANEEGFAWDSHGKTVASEAARGQIDEGTPRTVEPSAAQWKQYSKVAQANGKQTWSILASPGADKIGTQVGAPKPGNGAPENAFGGLPTPSQERLVRRRGNFACQRDPCGEGLSANVELAAAFAKMQRHYQTLGDPWRERHYRTALEVIRRLPIEVASAGDLQHPSLQRLGQKTRDKILEFLLTGHIERAERADADPTSRALEELQAIWGVGLATARQWLGRGCRTAEDVRRRAPQLGLSPDQEIGLRYFEEFRQRIPRAEVAQILDVVRSAVQRLACPGLRMEACGSYRRGAPTCGDVDVLVTVGGAARASRSRAGAPEAEVLSRLLRELGGFLTDHLKGQPFERGEERSRTAATYFGVCRLCPDKPHRRIDIKVYPETERPFALLAFTGSGHFNRSMRLYARRAGYTLSDHNIRPAKHAKGT